MSTIFIAFFLSLSQIAFAQKIIFAEKIDSLGNIFNSQSAYQIDLIRGNFVGIIFQSKQAISKPKMYAFIDKKEGDSLYKEFDTQRISIEKDSAKTAYCNYLFTEEGLYRIAFANAEKQEISHAFLTISFKNNIVFCEQIDENDLPINHKNKFKINSKRNIDIFSFLKMSKPMNCSDIFHNVYRYDGKNYTNLINSDTFAVKADWKYTYIKATYSEIGKYKIVIRTNSNKVLGINYLEIK